MVFVADTDGEFARYVPYETEAPRPVLGTAGLVAAAWHWAWERQGAPQLNARFEQLPAGGWPGDWAAGIAVKALVQAVLRCESTDSRRCATSFSATRWTLMASRATR